MPAQVDRGAYIGSVFVERDQAMFFELCQQMGGPKLLPSKIRENRNGSADRSGDLDTSDADAAGNDEGQAGSDAAENDGEV